MAVLQFYASTHGHTAKIASRIAEAKRGEGQEVDLRDGRHDSPPGGNGI